MVCRYESTNMSYDISKFVGVSARREVVFSEKTQRALSTAQIYCPNPTSSASAFTVGTGLNNPKIKNLCEGTDFGLICRVKDAIG